MMAMRGMKEIDVSGRRGHAPVMFDGGLSPGPVLVLRRGHKENRQGWELPKREIRFRRVKQLLAPEKQTQARPFPLAS